MLPAFWNTKKCRSWISITETASKPIRSQGSAGSGMICLNGAAARCVSVGDLIIIMAYASMTPEEAKSHRPKVVLTDGENKITKVTSYEKHGLLTEML